MAKKTPTKRSAGNPAPAGAVGIRKVAERAGVSITTVSHALSGKGRVGRETRERVVSVATELGYRPNASARNLRGRQTGLLVLAIPSPEGESLLDSDYAWFLRTMTAATAQALDRGYALVLATEDDERFPVNDLAFDGAIVAEPSADDEWLAELRSRRMPVVTMGRGPDGDGTNPSVDNDHCGAVGAVLDALAGRGSERPGLATLNGTTSYLKDCLRGYRRWCEDHDAEPLVATASRSHSAAYEAAYALLVRSDRPDSVHATSDEMARALEAAAADLKLELGRDLQLSSIVVRSEREMAPFVVRLDFQPEEVGRRAAGLLIDLLEGRELENEASIVPFRLLEADTV